MLYEEKGLFRYENNPIIKPSDYPGADAVFNCGQTMYGDTTILLCAIKMKDGSMPFMHVARSNDGVNFKFDPKPFITQSKLPHIHDLDGWPIDPRITYFPEEDTYYIMRPGNSDAGCVAFLGKTKDFETYEDIDVIALPNNRVPCLFPEKINGMYYRLDRPYVLLDDPHNYYQRGYIWISESPNLIHWGRHRILLKPWAPWNGIKIGPTPPIKTDEGWLEIIHGVSSSCSGQRYSLGAILLDLNDPTKIIGKCNDYLITPDREYEYNGIVPNVIFSCGAIADYKDDRLRVYYGAADTSIGLATGSISEIIAMCKK
ncbi:glycoside hydrolase family 130 protein [Ructibacterium gallinarum]|uniref:Glycoside hydrolase family 130 protein n=1 Tax=Ructibacterium gallinarum TaxID=2779355 RepID=A0A9D5M7B7_9FIRM|nr:glycoside hydrolase family 130 protein [Ructibacterium gallinarum]MBE5040877.1 glycoside hydrolase family 130 protein [Ructibacterium gallinarum]